MFPIQKIDHRESELYFCIFSPDGNFLVTGGKDANVDVWKVDPETYTIHSSRTFYTVEPSINHLCWSPDSKKWVSSSLLSSRKLNQFCGSTVQQCVIVSSTLHFVDCGRLKHPKIVVNPVDLIVNVCYIPNPYFLLIFSTLITWYWYQLILILFFTSMNLGVCNLPDSIKMKEFIYVNPVVTLEHFPFKVLYQFRQRFLPITFAGPIVGTVTIIFLYM